MLGCVRYLCRGYCLEEWSSHSRSLKDNHKLKLGRIVPQNLLSPAHHWAFEYSGLPAVSSVFLRVALCMFCLNWTCLSSEWGHAGSGICGCPLLALGTNLATNDHRLWRSFLLGVCKFKAETFMGSSLLSVVPEVLCMALALW